MLNLILIVSFVKADLQLTHYTIKDDYSAHNCTQLLPCGSMKTLKVHRKSECVLHTLQEEADMSIYEDSDESCLLCLQVFMAGGVEGVSSSRLVFVNGLESCIFR